MKGAENKERDVLELYDGQLALAGKKTLISANIPELKITATGKELFALSECLYAKWLSEGDDLRLVDKAVELCRKAVEEGYPHAVVRMAFYYDKDYVELDRTEEFRCRVACDYYSKVVYQDKPPKIDDGVSPEIPWEELRKHAARMLLDMLATAPPSLAKDTNDRYGYDYNSEQIRLRLNVSSEERSVPSRGERDREKLVRTVFNSCKHNKFRAPLFGVMRVPFDTARDVFAPKSPALKMSGDLNIWLYWGNRLMKASNSSAFADFVAGIVGGEVWIYFFNNNMGGHRYLNAKQRNDACQAMTEGNLEAFSRLKASAEEQERWEYLFSDDDVYYFMSGRLSNVKKAVDRLMEKVRSGKDWSES